MHTWGEKVSIIIWDKDGSCCFAVLYHRRKEPFWFGRTTRLDDGPAFLPLSGISSTPPTTESVPLALEATKSRKMSGSFTDNINSFNVSESFRENINSFNVSNVLKVSNRYTTAEHRSEILTWLSPLESRIRHQDLRTRRADNVGEWLLQTDEFKRWCDASQQVGSENATLFCCGGPAVGKTYLR